MSLGISNCVFKKKKSGKTPARADSVRGHRYAQELWLLYYASSKTLKVPTLLEILFSLETWKIDFFLIRTLNGSDIFKESLLLGVLKF